MSRRHISLLVRVAIAVVLLVWLVRSGSLDFGALAIFFERPALLVANLAVFVGTFLIAAVRWRLLLRTAGIQLALGRAVQLTFTGAFFNVVAPGNIGGEVVKAIYVARDLAPAQRPSVYLIAMFDRLLALGGLVAVAVVLNVVSSDSRVGEPTTAIALIALVTLVLPVAGLLLLRRYGKRFEETTESSSRFVKLFAQFVTAVRLVAEKPWSLALALGLSIAIQICGIVWFSAVASAVLDQDVSVARMAIVYPLGMLSVLLPISYAGFGVGHVAFKQLFTMVGLTGGANVLNVYLIGQVVPCVIGVIPYLMLKRDAGAPSEAELPSEAKR